MNETVGQTQRRLREAKRLSLRQLAALVPCNFALLSRIETGKQHPSDTIIRAIDAALNAGGELVQAKARQDFHRERARVASRAMKRRTLVASTVGTAVATLLPGRAEAGMRLGLTDVEKIRHRVIRLYAMDYTHGGESLWQAALGYAREAYWWLDHGTFSEAVGRHLMEATGRMQMCAGWLAFDAGHHDVARSCYNEALGIARQADDAEVETHALANLAFQANVQGSPRQAYRWADAADRAAAKTDAYARLAAIPQLRIALASALSGERSDFELAIGQARSVVDSDADRPVERWCSFLTQGELDGIEGTCAMELGQADRAVRLLSSAISDLGDEYARTRALYRARLARSYLDKNRDLEASAAAGNAALDDTQDVVASWRVAIELDALSQRLRPFHKHSAAQELLARYASTATATP